MIKSVNNVSFTARLKVDITDEYLDKLKNKPGADVSSARLLKGLKFLEKTAPMIGTDEDVLLLSNNVPEDRTFYHGSEDRLFLSLNGKSYKNVETGNYASGIKTQMKELFADLMESNDNQYVEYREADEIVDKIKEFNTVA